MWLVLTWIFLRLTMYYINLSLRLVSRLFLSASEPSLLPQIYLKLWIYYLSLPNYVWLVVTQDLFKTWDLLLVYT